MKTLKLITIATVCAAMCASCKSTPAVDVPAPTNTEIDSVSYLMGVNFGYFIKANGFADNLSEVNMTQIKKGMADFLNAKGAMGSDEFNASFKINPDKMNEIFSNFLAKKNSYVAAVNLAEGEAFLDKLYNKGGIEKTESGLLYEILSEGNEVKPVSDKDTVWCHYTGTLTDGTQFDASDREGDPVKFTLNSVIPGWTEGLKLIGEGGQIKLYVPASLGYGENGAGALIKANSVLVFDITLTKVGKCAEEEAAEE